MDPPCSNPLGRNKKLNENNILKTFNGFACVNLRVLIVHTSNENLFTHWLKRVSITLTIDTFSSSLINTTNRDSQIDVVPLRHQN